VRDLSSVTPPEATPAIADGVLKDALRPMRAAQRIGPANERPASGGKRVAANRGTLVLREAPKGLGRPRASGAWSRCRRPRGDERCPGLRLLR